MPSADSEAAIESLACGNCDLEAAFSVGLKIHISKKHQNIPPLDEESSSKINTDLWWDHNQIGLLMAFQMYLDVLKDRSILLKEKIMIGESE